MIESLLKKIQKESFDHFSDSKNNIINGKFTDSDDNNYEKLHIWLFDYNESSDTLSHWKLYPEKNEGLVKNALIKGGSGTIGYVQRSKKAEFVNNTFDDPRGTVSLEDEQIENFSWLGVPIINDNKVICILSFFYPEYDFWNEKYKTTKLNKVTKFIEHNYRDQLIVYNRTEELRKINDLFLKEVQLNDYIEILGEINNVALKILPYEFLLILKMRNSQEYSISSLYYNIDIFENNSKELLNWCSISKTKCDSSSCPFNELLKRDNGYEDLTLTHECKLKESFFDYIAPFHFQKLFIDNFTFLFFLTEDKNLDFKNIREKIEKLFLPFKEHYTALKNEKNKDYTKIKRMSELISLLGKNIGEAFVNKNNKENFISNLEQIFSSITISSKNTDSDSAGRKKRENRDSDNGNKNTNPENNCYGELYEDIEKIANKDNIILIQFWEENGSPIQVCQIDDSEIMDDTFKNEKNIFEHANINVFKRAIEANDKNIIEKYPPKIISDREVTSEDINLNFDNNKTTVEILTKDGFKLTIIAENATAPYLHHIIINDECFNKIINQNIQKIFGQNTIYGDLKEFKFSKHNYDVRLKNLYPIENNTDVISVENIVFIIGLREGDGYEESMEQIRKHTRNLYNYISLKKQKEFSREQALKSATAAIMSRNMSHNLGSHILSFIKNRLISTKAMIFSGVFENLLSKYNDINYAFKLNPNVDLIKDKIYEIQRSGIENQPHAMFLIGLGRLLNYLQERQDYIATVTSGTIPYFSSVNFKDFIFDEINFDFKAERHKSNHELCENLLLEYIAKSEGYSRSNVKICFEGYDGTLPSDEGKLDKMRSIEIDLPGGIVGRQAIFSILENIIRNSAKHGGKRENTDLVINISIDKDFSEDYYELCINDNIKNAEVNNNGKIVNNIELLNKFISEKIVDEDGRLIETNKGLKEMRISAAWLRRINITDIEKDDIGLKILSVENDGSNNILYKLYLAKPKKAALIGNWGKNQIDTINKKLVNKGFKFFTPEEYLKGKNLAYKFSIVEKSISLEIIEKIRRKSKVRFLEDEISPIKTEIEELYKNIYKKWLDEIMTGWEELNIIIDDSENRPEYKKTIKDSSRILLFEEVEEEPEKINIIFRVHNDEDSEFNDFKNNNADLFNQLDFLEGISGGNSTDRLIRHEIKDELWKMRMIESALTRVLIIDERIWSRITGVEDFEGNFGLEQNGTSVKYDVYNKKRINVLNFIKRNKISIFKELYMAVKSKDDVKINQNRKILFDNPAVDDIDKNKIAELLNNNKFEEVISLIEMIEPEVGKDEKIYFEIVNLNKETIGKIDSANSKIQVEFNEGVNLEYDFISIHQGILDKIYDTFFIKKENLDNSVPQNELDTLSGELSINEFFAEFKEKFKSKRRFLVHSGRSKPPYLPNDVAFIQYSSLENSFFDCKYSLTELLYSSVIEGD